MSDCKNCDCDKPTSIQLKPLELVCGKDISGCNVCEDPNNFICRYMQLFPDGAPDCDVKYFGDDCKWHSIPNLDKFNIASPLGTLTIAEQNCQYEIDVDICRSLSFITNTGVLQYDQTQVLSKDCKWVTIPSFRESNITLNVSGGLTGSAVGHVLNLGIDPCQVLASIPTGPDAVYGVTQLISSDCRKVVLPPFPAETKITPVDSASIDLSVSGTSDHTLSAEVKRSSNPDNAIADPSVTNGLYVPTMCAQVRALLPSSGVSQSGDSFLAINGNTCKLVSLPSETPVVVVDTASVDLNSTGANNHTLSANVKISGDSGNVVEIKSVNQGLYVPSVCTQLVSAVSTNPSSNDAMAGDQFWAVRGGQCTLVRMVVPSFSESPLTVIDTQTIDLTASGTANHTLKADVRIDTTSSSNAITSNANGLFVPDLCTQARSIGVAGSLVSTDTIMAIDAGGSCVRRAGFTETPFTATATDASLTLSTSGTNGHTLTAKANVSSDADNALSLASNGLYVPNACKQIKTNFIVRPNVVSANSLSFVMVDNDSCYKHVVGQKTVCDNPSTVIGLDSNNALQLYPQPNIPYGYTKTTWETNGVNPTPIGSYAVLPNSTTTITLECATDSVNFWTSFVTFTDSTSLIYSDTVIGGVRINGVDYPTVVYGTSYDEPGQRLSTMGGGMNGMGMMTMAIGGASPSGQPSSLIVGINTISLIAQVDNQKNLVTGNRGLTLGQLMIQKQRA